MLVVSAVLVGIAIALDGPVSKVINGLAGIGWIASAILVARLTLHKRGGQRVIAVAVAVYLVLVLAIKPSDLL
jgi:hypothetical protein